MLLNLENNERIKVLLIEDSAQDAVLLRCKLEDVDHANVEIEQVTSLAGAKPLLAEYGFDVVLIDLGLPDSTGFDTLHRLRSFAPDVPVVVLTGLEDDELAIRTIQAGAQDYLSKQHMIGPLLFRVIRHSIARHRQLRYFKDAARTDGLTGVPNRRAFDDELQRQVACFRRHGATFSLVLVDIDNFKEFNDQHGHMVGDEVLRDVASVLVRNVRETDVVGRFGGEEFGIALQATDLLGANLVAERLRLAVFAHVCELDGQQFQVAVSVGVTEVRAGDENQSVLSRADSALYAAKHAGRNCCYAIDDASCKYVDAMQIAIEQLNGARLIQES